jgi:diaminopimelate decarboxylase
VASLRELLMAKRAGFAPDRVHLHGNNKSLEALTLALEWGIHSIVVDSLDEMDFLTEIASKMGKVARIWLRITPGMEIDNVHPYMQTGSSSSKFGLSVIDGTAAKGIQRAKANRWLNLTGLHIHLGSQIYFGEPYANALRMLIEMAEREGIIPTEISPGGGWGQPYVPEQLKAARPVSDWVTSVCNAVNEEYSKRNWPLPKLIIEPGRYIVARAGVTIYRVGATKFSADGTYFVAVDGGLADNPRPALYTAQYTALMVDAPEAEPKFSTHIVGKFCESGDELIKGIMMPKVKRWDMLAMPVTGAYQLSMSSNYNMAPRPCVLWLEKDNAEVLQKRESPELAGWWVSADE